MEDVTRGNEASLQRLQESLVDKRTPAPMVMDGHRPVVQRRPGRQCLAIFIVESADRRVSAIVSSFREAQDHFECLAPHEFALTKECSLMDMINVMEAIREQLQSAGFDCQAGTAERLRGEEKEDLLRRARESSNTFAGKGH